MGNIMLIYSFCTLLDNTAVLLTPSIATQCGFSMKHDQFGNALIYISLQNCFSQNVVTRLKFSIFIQSELHQVVETCQYNAWASREVICDYNYMEVVVILYLTFGFSTTVVFFTPEGEKPMSVADAQRRGYGIRNTPTRLVLRSPMMAPETYMQQVSGVPMRVFKTSTIFEKKWLATQVDAAAACPIQEGKDTLGPTCFMDPMISSGQFKLLEVHFGINGQRLNPLELQARGYSVALNDFYVITELPIGGVGGYYKSHIQDDKYYVSYMIEPMLELLWTEDATNEQTRYKVLFHIATHLVPQPLELIDKTVPGEMTFKMVLGHFAVDVALINITFPAEVLSMADCSVRGFNILEHMSPNSSMKVFTLEVPFSDPAVLKQAGDGVTIFSLHLTFGLMLMDELEFFSYNAHLEAVVQNIVPPSVSGGCDKENFYVLVKYGSRGYNFQTLVGKRLMTPSLAQHYDYMENGTHFSFVVPFSSPDVAVEAIQSSFIKGRLDVILNNPETNSEIQEFSVACNFLSTLTECFPNGTMTALALKLESVPSLNPSKLTLEDPSCGPVFSNDRYAFFVFTVNSCGTKRKFMSNAMLYENEISLPDEDLAKKDPNSKEPEYDLKVSCVYDIDTNQAVAFNTRPRRSEPYAENSKGQLQVVMRLAMDESYSKFQSTEDYPIAKYLQQPLYFEVELLKSTNPLVSLELENCWATKGERTSQPRWNLIINGCPNPVDPYQVVFHPVWADARVRYPSHFKRFEVKMFAFLLDLNLVLQIFVHCDVVICDAKNPLGGVCGKQCSKTKEMIRGEFEIEVQLGGGRGMLYYCALSSLDCINLNLLLFCWQVKNVTFLRSWILNMYQLDQYA
uniref:Zona pellucida protein AX 2 n=1 Tax=Cyprinodon variegatus TaxID=28743 RepID=A0A3Q2FDF0_CYPVA